MAVVQDFEVCYLVGNAMKIKCEITVRGYLISCEQLVSLSVELITLVINCQFVVNLLNHPL